MKFPPEWIPTFVGAGILGIVGYTLLFLDWLEARRKKKSGSSKPEGG